MSTDGIDLQILNIFKLYSYGLLGVATHQLK